MLDFYDDIIDLDEFDHLGRHCLGRDLEDPFIATPNVFGDTRGGFCQKMCQMPGFFDPSRIKQVNHSYSKAGIFRGFHAQLREFCQGKFVENLTVDAPLFDVVVDARPMSKTFGNVEIFLLEPANASDHNLLWVPRGFLHGFMTPTEYLDTNTGKMISCKDTTFVFQYYCDNIYNKESEIGVNPIKPLTKVREKIKTDYYMPAAYAIDGMSFQMSDKDKNGADLDKWLEEIQNQYKNLGNVWYK